MYDSTRWRLKTAPVGIAVVAVTLSLIVEPGRRGARQEAAIDAIEKLDGMIAARLG